jgi:hypothetical protein
MWTLVRRAALLALMLVVVAGAGLAGPAPGQKCASSKLKASGKDAYGLLKCWAKAQAKGEAVDLPCLDKAEGKLLGAFAKAEDKGGCESTGDASAIDAAVDAFVTATTAALGTAGKSACEAAKEKAAGKKAASKLTCHAKAVSKGAAVDPLCLTKAEDKFVSGFAKAEDKGDCAATGDAAAIEALVDSLVSTVLAIVQPVATTTTTPASTTTTTTAVTSTTTTTVAASTTTSTTAASTSTTTSTPASSTTTTSAATTTTTTTTLPTTSTTTSTSTTTTTLVTPVSFSSQVQPIFNASCVGCHGASSPAAGLNLSAGAAYAALVGKPSTKCASYQLVQAGAPSSSYLVFKLQGSGPCFKGSQMPTGTPLPAAQIQLISNWILQGALNN